MKKQYKLHTLVRSCPEQDEIGGLYLVCAETGTRTRVLTETVSTETVSTETVSTDTVSAGMRLKINSASDGGDAKLHFVHYPLCEAFRMRNIFIVSDSGYLCDLSEDGGDDRPFSDQDPLSVPKTMWGSDWLYRTSGAYPNSDGGFVFVLPKSIIDLGSVTCQNRTTDRAEFRRAESSSAEFRRAESSSAECRRITGKLVNSAPNAGLKAIDNDWLGAEFTFDRNGFDSVEQVIRYLENPKTTNVCVCLNQAGDRIKTVSEYSAPTEKKGHVTEPRCFLFN